MRKLAKDIRTGANTIVEYDIVSKINELVEWTNKTEDVLGKITEWIKLKNDK